MYCRKGGIFAESTSRTWGWHYDPIRAPTFLFRAKLAGAFGDDRLPCAWEDSAMYALVARLVCCAKGRLAAKQRQPAGSNPENTPEWSVQSRAFDQLSNVAHPLFVRRVSRQLVTRMVHEYLSAWRKYPTQKRKEKPRNGIHAPSRVLPCIEPITMPPLKTGGDRTLRPVDQCVTIYIFMGRPTC